MLQNASNAAERRRNPLSDRTNSNPTKSNPLSSSSSSSSFNKTVTRCGATGRDVSESISVFCSRIQILNEKKKNKNKEMTNSKISNIRDKNVEVEGFVPLTVPCRKKRRVVSCEKDASEDSQLQDFIEKQKAYFKEVDEFQLPEEEVESVNELD